MKFVMPLLVAALLLAALPMAAQQKPTATGQRNIRQRGGRRQLAEQRAQSLDAGDSYQTPNGRRALLRKAGAVVVQVNQQLDKTATIKTLAGTGNSLEGYTVDFEIAAGYTVLKSDSTRRQLHLSQPKALQETIASARKTAALHSANPLFIDPQSSHWLIPTTNIILCLQTNIDAKTYFGTNWARARRLGGTADQFVLALATSTAEEMLAEVNRHGADSRVRWAEPDFINQEIPQTLDPLYPKQWHLHNTGQTGAKAGADIHAEEAWALTTGKANIIVAIIDDAIQIEHPDLSASIFTNPGEIAGNAWDDDGNGYVDDVHGWNFGANNNNPSPGPTSTDNHGTQTAGLAIAVANNNVGVAGVASGCKLLPVTGLNISSSQRAETFYYAAGRTASGGTWRGADVISFSVTTPQSTALDTALNWAATSGRNGKGCAMFCSSGNDAAAWYEWGLTITNAGNHTIQWNYTKDPSYSDCADTSWLDSITYPDGSHENFEAGGLPAGFTTKGSALWTYVTNNIGGNHAMVGWNGPNSHALRAGHIMDNQESTLSLFRYLPAGTMTFWLWTESETDYDTLDVWLDGVYQYSDTGCQTISTAVGYPASSADTIAVGASTDFDYRADFSDYGANLDFIAPGGGGVAGTPTTDRTGANGDNTISGTGGDYSLDFAGTSASAPIAAGVAALMLSFNPSLTAADIRSIMRRSCDKVGDVAYDSNGFHPGYGYGRVNAYRALTNCYADLQLSLRANLNPAGVGKNLVYTLTIYNAGPASSGGISLTNVFAQDVTFVSASPAAASASTRTITWSNLPRIAAKTSQTVTLTVAPRALGNLYCSAVVAGTAPELATGNNTATSLIPVVDLTPPVVTFVAPAAGQRITNSAAPVTLIGKASDNILVTNVQYQFNGGDWSTPDSTNGDINWTASLMPVAGTNRVKAYATDSNANKSSTNTLSFIYVVPGPLTLITNGLGSITHGFTGNLLEVGRAYTVTAVPGAGQVFSNWVGTVSSSSAVLQFIMQSNMVLQANFIPNPFLLAQGLYNGLFAEPVRVHNHSGFFTLTLADHGAYSASLKRGTNVYPFSGQFDVSGAASKTVVSWLVNLSLDLAGAEKLTGTVNGNGWSADLLANRYVFNSLTNPASQFKGTYTLILPGAANSASLPAGHGFGTVTVGPAGYVTLNGTLGDNFTWSQNVPLSRDGQWACYVPLYGGLGSIWSWLLFDTNQPAAQINGALSWIRPPRTGALYYPLGFTNDVLAAGSRYTAPTNATTRVIDLTNGVVIFDGGNLSTPFTNLVTLTSSNRVINGSPNSLSFSVTKSNGLFSGSVKVPGTTRTNTFKGALLQDLDSGYGYFLGTNQSGSVFLSPP